MTDGAFLFNECESANVGQESQNDSEQLEELPSMFLTGKRWLLSYDCFFAASFFISDAKVVVNAPTVGNVTCVP
jgi:hypothetical protein